MLTHGTLKHDGATYEAVPARIVRTDLGYEDHGIFTAMMTLEWGSSAQGMPGYAFGKGDDKDRAGAFIRRVLAVVGASRWEDVVGRSVYALRADGMVRGLASVDDDAQRVFIAADLFADERVS